MQGLHLAEVPQLDHSRFVDTEYVMGLEAQTFSENIEQILAVDPSIVLMKGAFYAHKLLTEGPATIEANLIKGEGEALDTFYRTFLKPEFANVAAIGEFGGSKSKLFEYGHKVIGGLHDVVYVQATPELTAEQLLGNPQYYEKTKQVGDGKPVIERISGQIQSYFHGGMQAAYIDEANRANPRTLGTGANALSGRYIERPDGKEHLDDLLIVSFGYNPEETARTTSPLPPVIAARIPAAVIMSKEANERERLHDIFGFKKTPENIKEVLTIPQLLIAKAAVGLVAVTDFKDQFVEATIAMRKELKQNEEVRFGEAAPRPMLQIIEDAQTRALGRQEVKVTEDDILGAVGSKVVSALANNGHPDLEEVDRTADDIKTQVQDKFAEIRSQKQAKAARKR